VTRRGDHAGKLVKEELEATVLGKEGRPNAGGQIERRWVAKEHTPAYHITLWLAIEIFGS
jgi:hypothetical protein